MHFSLTCEHRKNFSGAGGTHPKIARHQTRLTLEFLANELLEQKMNLVYMGILSIIFKVQPGVSHIHTHSHLRMQRPRCALVLGFFLR